MKKSLLPLAITTAIVVSSFASLPTSVSAQTASPSPAPTSTAPTSGFDFGQFTSDISGMIQEVQGLMSQVNSVTDIINRLPDLLSRLGLGGDSNSTSSQQGQIFKDSMGALGLPDMAKVQEESLKKAGKSKDPTRDAIPETIRVTNENQVVASKIMRDRILGEKAQQEGKKARESIGNISLQAQNRNQPAADAAEGSANAIELVNNNRTDAARFASTVETLTKDSDKVLESAKKAESTQEVVKFMVEAAVLNNRQSLERTAIEMKRMENDVAFSGQLSNVSSQLSLIQQTSANVVAAEAAQVVQNDELLRLQGATYDVAEQTRRIAEGNRQREIQQQAGEVGSYLRLLKTGYRSAGTYRN